MSDKITLAEFTRPEVELPGGETYTITVATKAVVAAVDKIEEQIEAAESPDDLIAAYCELFDLRLQPVAPKQLKASKVIKRMWDANEVGLPALMRLSIDIGATDSPF